MDWLRSLVSRIWGLFGKRRSDQELDDELRSHLEMLAEENLQRGMNPVEARAAARRSLGGLEQLKEVYREQRGLPWLDTLWQDLRFGLRMLRKNPSFTAIAVLTLALGIGANTAVFSLMDAVLLRNLPVVHPEQLVLVGWEVSKWPRGIRQSGYGDSLAYHLYRDLKSHNEVFSSYFGFAPMGFDPGSTAIHVDGETTLQDGAIVTGSYFSGLGVPPALGRTINDQDDAPGSPRVVVLSYDYWSRRFGRDPRVVGKSIDVNAVPTVIVGVAPRGFAGVQPGRSTDLWVSIGDGRGLAPFGSLPEKERALLEDDQWFWLQTMGRLKPGVSLAQAQSSFDVSFHQFLRSRYLPDTPEPDLPHIQFAEGSQGMEMLRRAYRNPLRLLQGMVALVLLIACANLAALLLARATARRGEMGIRLALGASRSRLIRQMIVESILLAAAGVGLALLFVRWGARTLYLLLSSGGAPSAGGRPIGLDVRLDGTVLGFAVSLALLTSLLAGLAPAFRATRVDLSSALKEAPRGSASGHGGQPWMRRLLVFSQVALSVMLLAGAGLFLRTLRNLETQDLGFRREQLLLFGLNPTQNGYDRPRLLNLYEQLLERLQVLPGVRSATASQLALISGWVNSGPATPEDSPTPSGRLPTILSNNVGPRFLETMGIPLVLGRDIQKRDIRDAPRVAVINETLARTFWPKENPLGRRFSFGDRYDPAKAFEVIGVARDAKFARVREQPRPTFYFPYTQTPWKLGMMYFEVRAAVTPAALATAIHNTVRSLDPGLPLLDFKTQAEEIEESFVQERLFARLSTFFAALAVLLVSVGLYGLLAYAVAQRTHEIGIRMALGAERDKILRLILAEGIWLAAAGTVAGVAGALAAGRLIRSYLFGVASDDPWTLAVVSLLLWTVALAACWIPARRATRVEPLVALRYE